MQRVGTIELELVDDTRPVYLGGSGPGRRLRLKLWYPADPAPGAEPERLWDSLRRRPDMPLPVRIALGLVRARSASYPSAPFAALAPARLPVIYNHGLVSFAAENTRLMEALARRGHVVIAVEHAAQLVEWQTLVRAQPAADKQRARALQERLQQTGAARSTVARWEIAREYYEASVNTNAVVRERARDSRMVLDRLPEMLAAIPGANSMPAARAYLVGFSLGGAVSLTLGQQDPRVAGVVNIDGGAQGVIDARTLARPCLMLYSDGNRGINDALLPGSARRETAASARHLNLHDAAALWPKTLRLLGATGGADPVAVLGWRDRLTTEFCAEVS